MMMTSPSSITKGVRKLDKPQNVQVQLTPSKKAMLVVVYADGQSLTLPISKKVAEVLIANGTSYGS